ncbi:MAG TPA: PTS sugar transporter subunit IIA, partial [Thermoanaerobaculia bacterium]
EGPALFAPDQVMVCLSSKGPAADSLLRYGSRLAGRLERNWFAVYVQTPGEAPEKLDATTQRQIADTLELAQKLGASVFTYRGDEVVGTILRFAREYGVGHVVVGRPGPRKPLRRLLGRPGAVHELLEKAAGLTVVVVDPQAPAVTPAAVPVFEPPPGPPSGSRRAVVDASDLLQPRAVLVLPACPSKQELIRLLLERLARLHPRLDGASALRRLLRREQEGSTFLDTGVGLPHARIPGLGPPLAALALCPHATAKGDPRVTLLLLLAEENPEEALALLAAAARVFRREEAIATLAGAADGEQAVARWKSLIGAAL